MNSKILERDVLRRARRVLAQLYPTGRDVRVIVYDSGLDPARIDFDGGAESVWFAVLSEAERAGRVMNLLHLVLQQYPSNPGLRELVRLLEDPRPEPVTADRDHRPRLFLSSSMQDREVVGRVREGLVSIGFDPLTVEESLALGEDFRAGVLRAIEGSDAAMVFVSAAARLSTHLPDEMRAILQRQRQSSGYLVVPVRLDDSALPDEVVTFTSLDLREFKRGPLPQRAEVALTTLHERLVLGRVAPQIVEEADAAGSRLLSYLRRLAAS